MPEGGKPYTKSLSAIKDNKMPMGSSSPGSSHGSNAKVRYASKQSNHAESVARPPNGGNGRNGGGKTYNSKNLHSDDGCSIQTINKNMAGENEFSNNARKIREKQKPSRRGQAEQSHGSDSPRAKPMTRVAKKEKNFTTESYF